MSPDAPTAPAGILPEVIVCARFELRRVDESYTDAVLAAAAASQSELGRWLPWADPLPSADEERAFLAAMRGSFGAGQDFTYFLVEPPFAGGDLPEAAAELGTGELVGGIGLHRRGPRRAEIGYWVRSDRHRRGHATEAARALTTVAFEVLETLDTIRISMDKANEASIGVPRKLGYRRVGEDRARPQITTGQTGHGWIWEIDRRDWVAR